MDEQERPAVDSGRRDFLKKSLVAGAVVWGAPAVTSLPAGRAWAQTYERCICAGNAFGLGLSLLGGPMQFFGVDGSLVNVGPIAIPTVGGSVAATAVTGSDTSSEGGGCSGTASIATANVVVGPAITPILTVAATVISSQASANCVPCGTTGSSSIASLTVNGISVNVTGACNLNVLNLGLVFVNEQSCNVNDGGTLSVNAIHVVVPGIINLILAHSEAGAGDPVTGDGCPCVAC